MGQDLRELFKKEREKRYAMKAGHEQRFKTRLDKVMPRKKRSSFTAIKVAASVLVLLSVGLFVYRESAEKNPIKTTVVSEDNGAKEVSGISLGDLSPDLKKVENYYMANINLELSQV
jgi:hypothetical protein